MSGRHLFGELTMDFTPERRTRVDARKAELRAAMPLHELRHARAMTGRWSATCSRSTTDSVLS